MNSNPKLIKLLAIVISLGIFLLAFVGLYIWRVSQNPFRRTDLRFEGDWPLAGHDRLGYSGVANGTSHMRKLNLELKYDIYTDDHGVRVNQPGEQKGSAAQILTIGGSCAYGYGLRNEDTFSEMLGERLNVPVANLAQVGYGTLQSLITLQDFLERGGKPKVVIYPFIQDHLRRNLSPCAPSGAPYCLPAPRLDLTTSPPTIVPPNMEYFTPEQNWQYYRDILTSDKPSWRDVIWRMRIDLFRIKTSAELMGNPDEAAQSRALAYTLGEIASICEANNAQLIVLFLPYFAREEPNEPDQVFLDALDDRMLFIDLTPEAQALDDPRVLGFKGDGHPNRDAHTLITNKIGEVIETQNLLNQK